MLSSPYLKKKISLIENLRAEVLHFPLNNLLEAKLSRYALFSSVYYGLLLSGVEVFLDDAERCILFGEKPDIPRQKLLALENYKKIILYIHGYYDKGNASFSNQFVQNINMSLMVNIRSALEIGAYRIRDIEGGSEVSRIPTEMGELFTYLDESDDHPLIRAGIFYVKFQKIAPFFWGNGRTARTLMLLAMFRMGYAFGGFFAPEVFFAQNHARKHNHLLKQALASEEAVMAFLEYYIYCLCQTAAKTLRYMEDPSLIDSENSFDSLTERQRKLLVYLEKHKIISLGEYLLSISPERSDATKDFEKLRRMGFIEKKGFGQSTYYLLRKKI